MKRVAKKREALFSRVHDVRLFRVQRQPVVVNSLSHLRQSSFEPVTGYRAGGPHGLAPGEWTDDTSMALALADSIAEVGWDLND